MLKTDKAIEPKGQEGKIISHSQTAYISWGGVTDRFWWEEIDTTSINPIVFKQDLCGLDSFTFTITGVKDEKIK